MTVIKRSKRIKYLTYGLFFYLILALSWWTLLLIVKNGDAMNAKIELMRIVSIANNSSLTEEAFSQQSDVVQLIKEYTRQKYMIIGEAAVFIILLFVGIFQINKSFNREVDAANQQRNFLLSITHELKSPLASIKLILQTFQKRTLTDDKKNILIDAGLTETNRLNNLVNDLLLSAKLEKVYQPVFEDINIKDLLEDCIKNMQNSHPNAQINLHLTEESHYIKLDREGFYTIVKNLIENGIKYNTESPQIEVEFKKHEKGNTLSISDNGIGISDKDKKKVFNKFYRIGNEDTRKTKGTGLGLYIVKEFIKAHEAEIEIENNTPKGTRFVIQF